MNLFPLLIALLLVINPFLGWIFTKLKIQAEKLHFWVMVTSGAAWVVSCIYFIIDPDSHLNPVWDAGAELLPSLAFSQDWVSSALILSVAAMVFFSSLSQQDLPRKSAWLAGLGGACVIGLGSDSAYTLALLWTVVEIIHFYLSYRDQQITPDLRKYIPVVLLRLAAPVVVILLSLTTGSSSSSGYLTDMDPGTGPALIMAGAVGFLGWCLSSRVGGKSHPPNFAGSTANWIPALMGLMLMVRGGELTHLGINTVSFSLILVLLLLGTGVAGLLLGLTADFWFLGCGLMAASSALISGPESALSWGIVFFLPGRQIWNEIRNPKISLIALVAASAGLLPVPFLPAWPGVWAFQEGFEGILLGMSSAVFLGSAFVVALKNWRKPGEEGNPFNLLGILGAGVLILSQVLISIRLDLLGLSRNLLSSPIMIWLGLLGIIIVLVLGNRVPLKKGADWVENSVKVTSSAGVSMTRAVHLFDRMVRFISRLFEGQAGLIWALLIGFLILTLVSVRGG